MSCRRILPAILIAALSIFVSLDALSSDSKCSHACLPQNAAANGGADEPVAASAEPGQPAPCTDALSRSVAKVESVNQQLKPVKEIVGYVRSPQGLAIKLVNDHVVRIPAWVGYALDPVGSLKHRAIDEARDRARDALKRNLPSGESACAAPAAATIPGTAASAADMDV